MKSHAEHLRVATYNVHKCRGMDRKTSPERIARILQGLDADVIGVQEILDVRDGPAELDQAQHLDVCCDCRLRQVAEQPKDLAATPKMAKPTTTIAQAAILRATHGTEIKPGASAPTPPVKPN